MSQLLAHRAAVRAAQFAIAAAGILFLLLLFSRQAHAAAGDGRPGALAGVTRPPRRWPARSRRGPQRPAARSAARPPL